MSHSLSVFLQELLSCPQDALVQELKSQGGVAKERIDAEVKVLLELKKQLGIALAAKSGNKKNKATDK